MAQKKPVCTCGEPIAEDRIETARARGAKALYCSATCVNRERTARYRARLAAKPTKKK